MTFLEHGILLVKIAIKNWLKPQNGYNKIITLKQGICILIYFVLEMIRVMYLTHPGSFKFINVPKCTFNWDMITI